eukprot:g5955.t1
MDLPEQRALREKSEIHVSDKEGFLCHIHMDVDIRLTPKELMRVFSNPDNSGVFRDIYGVPYRKVMEDDGNGRQKVLVEQLSGFKFLVVPITFTTCLNVERNMNKLTFRYWLAKKGIMKKFSGEWYLHPIYSVDDGSKIIGTRAILEQDLLPSFIPILCHGIYKGISARAVQRLVEDLRNLADKYHKGVTFEELLRPTYNKHEVDENQSDDIQAI